MTRALYFFPITLASIATFLHLLGMVGLFQPEISRGAHMLLYAIAIVVVIGLFAQSFWGYWLAVALFLGQSIMQPYWGYQSFAQGHVGQLLVTSPMVIVALGVLLFKQRLFMKTST